MWQRNKLQIRWPYKNASFPLLSAPWGGSGLWAVCTGKLMARDHCRSVQRRFLAGRWPTVGAKFTKVHALEISQISRENSSDEEVSKKVHLASTRLFCHWSSTGLFDIDHWCLASRKWSASSAIHSNLDRPPLARPRCHVSSFWSRYHPDP